MRTKNLIAEHKVRLPDAGLANLLGLKLDQYHSLKHHPLSYYTNKDGDVVEYFMIVSDANDRELLAQLKLNQNNYLRFRPEEVHAHFV
jgi:predicted glycosyltransferase